jgi:Tol biopolymer transport system component
LKGLGILLLSLGALAVGLFRGVCLSSDGLKPQPAAESSQVHSGQAPNPASVGSPDNTASGAPQGRDGGSTPGGEASGHNGSKMVEPGVADRTGKGPQPVEATTSQAPDARNGSGEVKECEEGSKTTEAGEVPAPPGHGAAPVPPEPQGNGGVAGKAAGETEQAAVEGENRPALEKVKTDEPPALEPVSVHSLTPVQPGHNDSNPVWSPTGELLAFERSIDEKREIIICRLDGSVVQRVYYRTPEAETGGPMQTFLSGILDEASFNSGITWSLDGKSLVFMSNGGRGNYDLYLLPELGKDTIIRLTENPERDGQPRWSPVANEVVFVSGRTGKADIYLLKLEPRALIKLTQGEKSYLYPEWSPDGRKIAMIYGSNDNHDVYLIENVARPIASLRPITTWTYDDLRPTWSPDGKKIAFYSNYNAEDDPKVWSIIVISLDNSNNMQADFLASKVVAVNVVPDIEQGPTWMPDSKKIVYVKNDGEAFNPIYIVDIEQKTNLLVKTDTKMNHDVACSRDGTLAYRAQVEQWDHIYIANLKK